MTELSHFIIRLLTDSPRRPVPGLYHHAFADVLTAAGDDPLPVFQTQLVLDSAVFEVMVRRVMFVYHSLLNIWLSKLNLAFHASLIFSVRHRGWSIGLAVNSVMVVHTG